TTVSQPMYEIGAVAARMLIKMLNGEEIDDYQKILKHKIVLRNSCISPKD
ncbi:MAG TPA: substrate-binding domain-containing protein, partial [Thermoanaerobacter sp.]|nr:substrate-binding domain-containing protein [Thermoanaerobacter sp.]